MMEVDLGNCKTEFAHSYLYGFSHWRKASIFIMNNIVKYFLHAPVFLHK